MEAYTTISNKKRPPSLSESVRLASFHTVCSSPAVQDAAAKSIGRPSIGGPFSLVDANGQPFSDQDMLGKWTLIYFGFTNCPDICPEELDKMGDAVDLLEAKVGQGKVLPIFVSVDPARDSIAQVKRYMSGVFGVKGRYGRD